MRNSPNSQLVISISSYVSVQYGLEQSAKLNFSLVRGTLATYDFMHIDFDLVLVSELAKLGAQEPVLVFFLGTIEMLCGTTQYTLVHSTLCLGCDAYVVESIDHQLIYDMIAVCALFTG
jgi:hypothetical protein